ncbi:MAG: PAS domain S-box protein, partial [Proteobacteria bacterium]
MKELNQNQIDVEAFFSFALDLFCVAGTDGFFKRLNPAFEDVLGFSAAELCLSPLINFLHPDDVAETQKRISALSAGKKVLDFEVRMLCKSGDYRTFSWKAAARDSLIYASARDITEAKQIQMERDRFFTTSLDLLAISDDGGHFTRVNPVVEQILGYTPEQFCATPYLDLIHPDDVARTMTEIGAQMGGREVLKFENRYRCKDGSYKWISWKSSPIGSVMYGCGRDITAEREQRSKIEDLNQQLEEKVTVRTQELEQTARRFERVVSSNMIGIIFWIF